VLDYYKRRAATYERVYLKPERQADLRAMEAWLPTTFAGRSVLEVACGTGWWTLHGARDAARWLATDLNPETMALARQKPLPACVELRSVDAYTLAEVGDETFDAAFAGCWWSHVPRQHLAGWLDRLHRQLRLKNFPSCDEALAMLGPRAHTPQWIDFDHYWLLHYQLD
jgi:ubiquinone/menaquinone biosynthesis C-methylase UbiE